MNRYGKEAVHPFTPFERAASVTLAIDFRFYSRNLYRLFPAATSPRMAKSLWITAAARFALRNEPNDGSFD